MLSEFISKEKSIEELEGHRWPEPTGNSTSLVRGVHELRRRAIKDLSAEDLRRLVGQDIGLQWLLPVALDFLRATAPQEAETGWYDDDLLSAVLTRNAETWRNAPELARHLNETVNMLTDLSPYIREEVEAFRSALSDVL
ncbi:contact-dependent growth inhibition system immunity protein [Streptomyces misionensis]|uniref:contact-dependent growth inhibition system immunity protein n=1 Tax=Streptomyces misionensis TaxID=67331 RepID=UPI00368DACA2